MKLRNEIDQAIQSERSKIEMQIKHLQFRYQELVNLIPDITKVGEEGKNLANKKGGIAARDYMYLTEKANAIILRVRDLLGHGDLWREIYDRDVDLWVVENNER